MARTFAAHGEPAANYVAAPLRPEPPVAAGSRPPSRAPADPFAELRQSVIQAVARAARRAGRAIPVAEERRDRVAEDIARSAPGLRPPPYEVVLFLARYRGVVETDPATFLLRAPAGHEAAVAQQFERAAAGLFRRGAWNRLGIGVVPDGEALVVVAALWEQQVELQPLPRALLSGGTARLVGRLLGAHKNPQIVITTPGGAVRRLPMTLKGGAFEAGFSCSFGDGACQIEILAADASGPAVLANFPVYCGVTPPSDVVAREEETDQDPADAEQQMFALINEARASAGLLPLVWDNRLAAIARSHSREMERGEFVAHVSPTTGDVMARLGRAGLSAALTGENVGQATGAKQAHDGFMASPGHRANVLNGKMTHIGIGIVGAHRQRGGAPLFITQIFVGGY